MNLTPAMLNACFRVCNYITDNHGVFDTHFPDDVVAAAKDLEHKITVEILNAIESAQAFCEIHQLEELEEMLKHVSVEIDNRIFLPEALEKES